MTAQTALLSSVSEAKNKSTCVRHRDVLQGFLLQGKGFCSPKTSPLPSHQKSIHTCMQRHLQAAHGAGRRLHICSRPVTPVCQPCTRPHLEGDLHAAAERIDCEVVTAWPGREVPIVCLPGVVAPVGRCCDWKLALYVDLYHLRGRGPLLSGAGHGPHGARPTLRSRRGPHSTFCLCELLNFAGFPGTHGFAPAVSSAISATFSACHTLCMHLHSTKSAFSKSPAAQHTVS